jgi:hypothetical protein
MMRQRDPAESDRAPEIGHFASPVNVGLNLKAAATRKRCDTGRHVPI